MTNEIGLKTKRQELIFSWEPAICREHTVGLEELMKQADSGLIEIGSVDEYKVRNHGDLYPRTSYAELDAVAERSSYIITANPLSVVRFWKSVNSKEISSTLFSHDLKFPEVRIQFTNQEPEEFTSIVREALAKDFLCLLNFYKESQQKAVKMLGHYIVDRFEGFEKEQGNKLYLEHIDLIRGKISTYALPNKDILEIINEIQIGQKG